MAPPFATWSGQLAKLDRRRRLIRVTKPPSNMSTNAPRINGLVEFEPVGGSTTGGGVGGGGAWATIVTEASSLLLDKFESGCVAVTEPMFVTVPLTAVVGTVTAIAITPVSPAAIDGLVQVTVLPELLHENCADVTPVTVT